MVKVAQPEDPAVHIYSILDIILLHEVHKQLTWMSNLTVSVPGCKVFNMEVNGDRLAFEGSTDWSDVPQPASWMQFLGQNVNLILAPSGIIVRSLEGVESIREVRYLYNV